MLEFHSLVVAQILLLLTLANGAPVILKKLLGPTWAWPLDGDITLADGQPLLGSSKTIRGVISAVLAASLGAPMIALDWRIGALVAVTAMLGDLFSSFVKRRMRRPPSSMALGLDQIPESLLPTLACRFFLPVSIFDALAITAIFLIGELVSARLFFALKIRDRPY